MPSQRADSLSLVTGERRQDLCRGMALRNMTVTRNPLTLRHFYNGRFSPPLFPCCFQLHMPLRTVNDARELAKRVLAASDAPLHYCGACNQPFTAKRSLVRHLEEARCPTLRAADKDIQTAFAAELRPSTGIIRAPSPPPPPSSQGPFHAFAVALTLCAPDAFALGPIEPTYNRNTTWLRMQGTARASPNTFWVSAPALRTVHSGRALLKRIERRRGSSLPLSLPRASSFVLKVQRSGLVASSRGVPVDGLDLDESEETAPAISSNRLKNTVSVWDETAAFGKMFNLAPVPEVRHR